MHWGSFFVGSMLMMVGGYFVTRYVIEVRSKKLRIKTKDDYGCYYD